MERICVSSIIDAPADTVWQYVRDFNGMPEWHPTIYDSAIEDGRPSDAVGCVRRFHLTDGSALCEQLVALSDRARSQTYIILDSPLPITDYIATLRVLPVTDGDRSMVKWTAEFEAKPGQAEQAVTTVREDVYQAGLDSLKAIFDRGVTDGLNALIPTWLRNANLIEDWMVSRQLTRGQSRCAER